MQWPKEKEQENKQLAGGFLPKQMHRLISYSKGNILSTTTMYYIITNNTEQEYSSFGPTSA
jgi:hypothetical protein